MNIYLYCTLLLVLSATGLGAQSVTIQGRVLEGGSGQYLENAHIRSVEEEGFSVTDQNGSFEIEVTRPEGTLEISVLGYKTQTVRYRGTQSIRVEMMPDFYRLNEVKVSAYSGHKSNRETAGAVSRISGTDLRQGSGVSMQAALNSVPGVRMDQSTLSDSRISIRGNGVRSPWGIRDVKIYVNDIPLTEADGTSRLEGIDVNDLGQAEIIRGPASSIYGGGTGGVMKFRMARAPYEEQSLEAAALAGSFGLKRLATVYRNNNTKMNSYVSYGRQHYDGYRDHSNDERDFITANFQLYPSEKQLITILANRTSQQSQIPGALTRTEYEENPQQASAQNLDKKAGRNQNWTRIGLGHQYQFDHGLTNSTSLFTYFYDLDHPLAFAYLHNYYQSFGGRTLFDYDPEWKSVPLTFRFGGEYNQANTKGTQYVNEGGKEGAISGNTDYDYDLFSLFLQTEWKISPRTDLTLGVSYNGLDYHVKDYLSAERSGVKKFKPQASPRVALSHHFGEGLSLHGSVSSGYSPPSGSEIQNADGSVNADLEAQKGWNYEINAKGNLLRGRLAYDLAIFKMDMKDELIAQAIAQGITVYHNSGRTGHDGAELALAGNLIREQDGKWISGLMMNVAVTYSDFTFVEYITVDSEGLPLNDFSGNALTGIAPWTVSGNLMMETRMGIYGNLAYFFNDRLPLNDLNTDFQDSWSLWNTKWGYRFSAGARFDVDLYAGIENLTNSRYSSFSALNAVAYGPAGPAYFNPSPSRNFYAGLKVKYHLK